MKAQGICVEITQNQIFRSQHSQFVNNQLQFSLMNFELTSTQSPQKNIKRILKEEVQFIQNQMQAKGNARHLAVHGSRKSFKRIRSVLRLVRKELGVQTYRKENEFYRDSSRLLADVRDSYVQIDTFKKAIDYQHFDPEWTTAVHDWLYDRHLLISAQKLDQEQVLIQVAQRMENGRNRIKSLPLDTDNFAAFNSGIKRIYKQGQGQMQAAYHDGQSIEKFHDWRKRVKYLWHHMELIHPFNPELCTQLATDLHTISDHLGDAHDYAVLAELLQTEGDHLLITNDAVQLLNQLYEEQRRLERAIRPLAEQIYNSSPKLFASQFNL